MQSCAKIPTPQALVNNVLQLISLPEVYLRLQKIIDDPEHTREQIARIVTHDPSLAVRVLRLANSSYYSFPREIKSVSAAVGIIGEIDLRNLVLATSVVGSMSRLGNEGVNIDEFWLHSLRCGISARLIARAVGGANAEILFLAGILHDIGILVIYQQDALLARAVDQQISSKHQLRDQAEREMLGFDHAEVGALLGQSWGLSMEICELLRCHHQFQLAGKSQRDAMILSLANQLAQNQSSGIKNPDIRLTTLQRQLDIDEPTLARLVETSDAQCVEIRNLILG